MNHLLPKALLVWCASQTIFFYITQSFKATHRNFKELLAASAGLYLFLFYF